MLKQSQRLKLLQKISPQQIQFIKLLQIPTLSMEQRIKEEVEKNPALEDERMGYDEEEKKYDDNDDGGDDMGLYTPDDRSRAERETSIEDYLASDNYDYRTSLPSNSRDEDDEYEAPIVQLNSLYDQLEDQLHMLSLEPKLLTIGEHIIGSIDEDGYLRRPAKSLAQDLMFRYHVQASVEEVQQMINTIQRFDPPGVGAGDLQECLLLQLQRRQQTPEVALAKTILGKYFEEFSKKHFSKIRQRLNISDDQLRDAYEVILHLNPKPGESESVVKHNYIIPDFILSIEGGDIRIRLNNRNAPELRVSRSYSKMYQDYKRMNKLSGRKDAKVRETFEFVKQRIEAAQWFIDAIKQRQYTLLNTMEAIVEKQREFFLSGGEERKLRPMILKDIADEIGMDISTVSRVANSKFVETEFGIYPLKYFFTEGIETDEGDIVSNREVKKALEEIIGKESKKRPLSDDRIAVMLKERGYNIARRTVAKYREQSGIAVARLRKEI